MSWIDRLDNRKLTITTGDGKVFSPLWIAAEKSIDFNNSKYEFIDVEGSFIDRKKNQGSKYQLLFYFQGDDNIDKSQDFENSSLDSRAWVVEHPFYGTLKGQPTSLKRNDKSYNVTEITVDFWESIDGEFPLSQVSAKNEVVSRVSSLNAQNVTFLVENANPKTSNIPTLKENVFLTSSKFNADNLTFSEYSNIVSKATKSADRLVIATTQSINDIQQVVNAPANFNEAIFRKIKYYEDAYQVLKELVIEGGLFEKYFFESQGSSIIAGMCNCAITDSDEFISRDEIEQANTSIIRVYEDYLKQMDDNQIVIYDTDNYWSPNVNIQSSLSSLISFTSKNLFIVSFSARQERIHETEKDTNLIILTHRFVGLDVEDKKIENFRKINNIKLNELFKIKKGREIKYFV